MHDTRINIVPVNYSLDSLMPILSPLPSQYGARMGMKLTWPPRYHSCDWEATQSARCTFHSITTLHLENRSSHYIKPNQLPTGARPRLCAAALKCESCIILRCRIPSIYHTTLPQSTHTAHPHNQGNTAHGVTNADPPLAHRHAQIHDQVTLRTSSTHRSDVRRKAAPPQRTKTGIIIIINPTTYLSNCCFRATSGCGIDHWSHPPQ